MNPSFKRVLISYFKKSASGFDKRYGFFAIGIVPGCSFILHSNKGV